MLLPGVTRLVAARREAANRRLWETLCDLLDDEQRAALDGLLEVTGAHDGLAEQAADDGDTIEPVILAQAWVEIEAVVPRSELAEALVAVVKPAWSTCTSPSPRCWWRSHTTSAGPRSSSMVCPR